MQPIRQKFTVAVLFVLSLALLFWPLIVRGDEPKPRYPRVVFLTGKSCPPCKAALRDFPDWLRKSGWQVDETQRAHVQIVSVEEREDLAVLYSVKMVPAMVLLTDDGKHSPPVVYTGRASLTRMFEPKPKPVARVAARHSHKCDRCSTEWWHGAEAASNPRAHNCPRCGREEFVVHREAGSPP